MLSLLDSLTLTESDDIAKELATDFRKRRIEKNLTRDQIAVLSGIAVSNIVRFEQKGLISLKNLIGIAMTLGYTSEVAHIFSEPKYSTMEELMQIRRNTNKKKAYKKNEGDRIQDNCGDLTRYNLGKQEIQSQHCLAFRKTSQRYH